MNENQNFTTNNSADDDFVIGKGFVVEQNTAQSGNGKGKKRKSSGGAGMVKNIIWIVAIFVISIGVAVGVIYVGADYLGIGFGRGGECVVEIAQGSSVSAIADALNEQGVVKVPIAFRLYSKMKGYETQYKYGVYTFKSDAGYGSIANMLMSEGAKAQTASGVTIPENATVDDIAKILEEAGVCTAKDFKYEVQNGTFDYDFVKEIPSQSVYYRLEGYLYPETYDFYSYDSAECAHLAIDKMLSTFEKRIAGELREQIDANQKYSLHEIMTMASVVEGECGNAGDEDRAKVARVFYNRLENINWDGPNFLQSDPTTHYPYGDGRYSTYESEGLPPGPLGAVSLRSLKAAANPAGKDFEMTYFVTDINGDFYYNSTLAGHNKIVAELKAKDMWVYSTLG